MRRSWLYAQRVHTIIARFDQVWLKPQPNSCYSSRLLLLGLSRYLKVIISFLYSPGCKVSMYFMDARQFFNVQCLCQWNVLGMV